MKRASYRAGVQWIADNDETADRDQPLDVIAGYISVGLLADLFAVTTDRVARDVFRIRRNQDKGKS